MFFQYVQRCSEKILPRKVLKKMKQNKIEKKQKRVIHIIIFIICMTSMKGNLKPYGEKY